MQPGQVPNFIDPRTGGEIGPSVEELAGRLVAFVPVSFDPNAPNKYHVPTDSNSSPTKPAVTADIVVLDGGQLYFGKALKASPPRPMPTHVVAIDATQRDQFGAPTGPMGAEFQGRVFSGANIVMALRDSVGRGIVLGRVVQGVGKGGNNPPWNIAKLEPTDPGRQLAAAYFGGRAAGTVTPYTPVELNPAPSANMPINPYGAQPQFAPPANMTPQGFMAPQPMPANLVPQMLVPGPHQPVATQPQGYAPAPAVQPPNPALYGNAQPAAPAAFVPPAPVQQAVAPVQQQFIPPVPAPGASIPPGYEGMWPQLTEAQRQQVQQQYAAQQQAAQAGPGAAQYYG